MKKSKMPKLTLKAAKTLAVRELGTATGLVAHEYNNSDYQRYEMKFGNYEAVISNMTSYFGITSLTVRGISGGSITTCFNTTTLEENDNITQHERESERFEIMRDFVTDRSKYVFEEIAKHYDVDYCVKAIKGEIK